MSKEKTAFEILANTLKAMAKQCTAKAKNNRAALMAIFDAVPHTTRIS